MNAFSNPARDGSAAAAAAATELAACASLEITAGRLDEVRAIAEMLPRGTRVFVNHLPRNGLAESLPTLAALHAAGLEPIPHVAARRIASRGELDDFFARATTEANVRRVLLVGGDVSPPAGPWADSVALLRARALSGAGLLEIGIAGYPEGHPRIEPRALADALSQKLALLGEQGLGAFMVTQFSFAPARVVALCERLAREHPCLALYPGMAGPTEAASLLRFAQRCGVSASLRALRDMGMNAVRVVTHTDPGDQLAALARYHATHAASNVAGIHLFTFGGARASAGWIRGVLAGGAQTA